MPALPCMAACAAACRIRTFARVSFSIRDDACWLLPVASCPLLSTRFYSIDQHSYRTIRAYTPVLHAHTDTQASTQEAARHPEVWPQHAAGTGDGRCTSLSSALILCTSWSARFSPLYLILSYSSIIYIIFYPLYLLWDPYFTLSKYIHV
jgi:hypothetical protein